MFYYIIIINIFNYNYIYYIIIVLLYYCNLNFIYSKTEIQISMYKNKIFHSQDIRFEIPIAN